MSIRSPHERWLLGGSARLRGRERSNNRGRSRHIPAAVRRAVWTRDGGRCASVGTNGRRCTETGLLECHHVEPYAVGGAATTANVSLRCKAHNNLESELVFGPHEPLLVRESRAEYVTNGNSVQDRVGAENGQHRASLSDSP